MKGDGGKGIWRKLVQAGGNILFSMLIFVIMLDPNNMILNMKNILFVLLVGYNIVFFRPDWRYLPHILLVISVVVLGYLFAEMQQNPVDMDTLLAVFKSFSPLILLLWISYYDVLKLSLIPAFIMCALLSVLYILVSASPIIREACWTLSARYDNVILLTFRSFYGFSIMGMYHKAMICMMFALAYFCYAFINYSGCRRWSMFLPFLLAVFTFLVSGTRSSMMVPLFLLGLVVYQRVRYSRYVRYLLYPVLALFAVSFVLLVIVLASETTEKSNMVKFAHLVSYMQLFESHPMYLLLGQGPGTSFYSEGFGEYTEVTEWTYMELLRNYGIWCVVIVAVLFKPLVTFYKYRKDNLTFVMLVAYFAYMLVAGTNPLLISSTGMMMVLSAYSYEWMLLHNGVGGGVAVSGGKKNGDSGSL